MGDETFRRPPPQYYQGAPHFITTPLLNQQSPTTDSTSLWHSRPPGPFSYPSLQLHPMYALQNQYASALNQPQYPGIDPQLVTFYTNMQVPGPSLFDAQQQFRAMLPRPYMISSQGPLQVSPPPTYLPPPPQFRYDRPPPRFRPRLTTHHHMRFPHFKGVNSYNRQRRYGDDHSPVGSDTESIHSQEDLPSTVSGIGENHGSDVTSLISVGSYSNCRTIDNSGGTQSLDSTSNYSSSTYSSSISTNSFNSSIEPSRSSCTKASIVSNSSIVSGDTVNSSSTNSSNTDSSSNSNNSSSNSSKTDSSSNSNNSSSNSSKTVSSSTNSSKTDSSSNSNTHSTSSVNSNITASCSSNESSPNTKSSSSSGNKSCVPSSSTCDSSSSRNTGSRSKSTSLSSSPSSFTSYCGMSVMFPPISTSYTPDDVDKALAEEVRLREKYVRTRLLITFPDPKVTTQYIRNLHPDINDVTVPTRDLCPRSFKADLHHPEQWRSTIEDLKHVGVEFGKLHASRYDTLPDGTDYSVDPCTLLVTNIGEEMDESYFRRVFPGVEHVSLQVTQIPDSRRTHQAPPNSSSCDKGSADESSTSRGFVVMHKLPTKSLRRAMLCFATPEVALEALRKAPEWLDTASAGRRIQVKLRRYKLKGDESSVSSGSSLDSERSNESDTKVKPDPSETKHAVQLNDLHINTGANETSSPVTEETRVQTTDKTARNTVADESGIRQIGNATNEPSDNADKSFSVEENRPSNDDNRICCTEKDTPSINANSCSSIEKDIPSNSANRSNSTEESRPSNNASFSCASSSVVLSNLFNDCLALTASEPEQVESLTKGLLDLEVQSISADNLRTLDGDGGFNLERNGDTDLSSNLMLEPSASISNSLSDTLDKNNHIETSDVLDNRNIECSNLTNKDIAPSNILHCRNIEPSDVLNNSNIECSNLANKDIAPSNILHCRNIETSDVLNNSNIECSNLANKDIAPSNILHCRNIEPSDVLNNSNIECSNLTNKDIAPSNILHCRNIEPSDVLNNSNIECSNLTNKDIAPSNILHCRNIEPSDVLNNSNIECSNLTNKDIAPSNILHCRNIEPSDVLNNSNIECSNLTNKDIAPSNILHCRNIEPSDVVENSVPEPLTKSSSNSSTTFQLEENNGSKSSSHISDVRLTTTDSKIAGDSLGSNDISTSDSKNSDSESSHINSVPTPSKFIIDSSVNADIVSRSPSLISESGNSNAVSFKAPNDSSLISNIIPETVSNSIYNSDINVKTVSNSITNSKHVLDSRLNQTASKPYKSSNHKETSEPVSIDISKDTATISSKTSDAPLINKNSDKNVNIKPSPSAFQNKNTILNCNYLSEKLSTDKISDKSDCIEISKPIFSSSKNENITISSSSDQTLSNKTSDKGDNSETKTQIYTSAKPSTSKILDESGDQEITFRVRKDIFAESLEKERTRNELFEDGGSEESLASDLFEEINNELTSSGVEDFLKSLNDNKNHSEDIYKLGNNPCEDTSTSPTKISNPNDCPFLDFRTIRTYSKNSSTRRSGTNSTSTTNKSTKDSKPKKSKYAKDKTYSVLSKEHADKKREKERKKSVEGADEIRSNNETGTESAESNQVSGHKIVKIYETVGNFFKNNQVGVGKMTKNNESGPKSSENDQVGVDKSSKDIGTHSSENDQVRIDESAKNIVIVTSEHNQVGVDKSTNDIGTNSSANNQVGVSKSTKNIGTNSSANDQVRIDESAKNIGKVTSENNQVGVDESAEDIGTNSSENHQVNINTIMKNYSLINMYTNQVSDAKIAKINETASRSTETGQTNVDEIDRNEEIGVKSSESNPVGNNIKFPTSDYLPPLPEIDQTSRINKHVDTEIEINFPGTPSLDIIEHVDITEFTSEIEGSRNDMSSSDSLEINSETHVETCDVQNLVTLSSEPVREIDNSRQPSCENSERNTSEKSNKEVCKKADKRDKCPNNLKNDRTKHFPKEFDKLLKEIDEPHKKGNTNEKSELERGKLTDDESLAFLEKDEECQSDINIYPQKISQLDHRTKTPDQLKKISKEDKSKNHIENMGSMEDEDCFSSIFKSPKKTAQSDYRPKNPDKLKKISKEGKSKNQNENLVSMDEESLSDIFINPKKISQLDHGTKTPDQLKKITKEDKSKNHIENLASREEDEDSFGSIFKSPKKTAQSDHRPKNPDKLKKISKEGKSKIQNENLVSMDEERVSDIFINPKKISQLDHGTKIPEKISEEDKSKNHIDNLTSMEEDIDSFGSIFESPKKTAQFDHRPKTPDKLKKSSKEDKSKNQDENLASMKESEDGFGSIFKSPKKTAQSDHRPKTPDKLKKSSKEDKGKNRNENLAYMEKDEDILSSISKSTKKTSQPHQGTMSHKNLKRDKSKNHRNEERTSKSIEKKAPLNAVIRDRKSLVVCDGNPSSKTDSKDRQEKNTESNNRNSSKNRYQSNESRTLKTKEIFCKKILPKSSEIDKEVTNKSRSDESKSSRSSSKIVKSNKDAHCDKVLSKDDVKSKSEHKSRSKKDENSQMKSDEITKLDKSTKKTEKETKSSERKNKEARADKSKRFEVDSGKEANSSKTEALKSNCQVSINKLSNKELIKLSAKNSRKKIEQIEVKTRETTAVASLFSSLIHEEKKAGVDKDFELSNEVKEPRKKKQKYSEQDKGNVIELDKNMNMSKTSSSTKSRLPNKTPQDIKRKDYQKKHYKTEDHKKSSNKKESMVESNKTNRKRPRSSSSNEDGRLSSKENQNRNHSIDPSEMGRKELRIYSGSKPGMEGMSNDIVSVQQNEIIPDQKSKEARKDSTKKSKKVQEDQSKRSLKTKQPHCKKNQLKKLQEKNYVKKYFSFIVSERNESVEKTTHIFQASSSNISDGGTNTNNKTTSVIPNENIAVSDEVPEITNKHVDISENTSGTINENIDGLINTPSNNNSEIYSEISNENIDVSNNNINSFNLKPKSRTVNIVEESIDKSHERYDCTDHNISNFEQSSQNTTKAPSISSVECENSYNLPVQGDQSMDIESENRSNPTDENEEHSTTVDEETVEINLLEEQTSTFLNYVTESNTVPERLGYDHIQTDRIDWSRKTNQRRPLDEDSVGDLSSVVHENREHINRPLDEISIGDEASMVNLSHEHTTNYRRPLDDISIANLDRDQVTEHRRPLDEISVGDAPIIDTPVQNEPNTVSEDTVSINTEGINTHKTRVNRSSDKINVAEPFSKEFVFRKPDFPVAPLDEKSIGGTSIARTSDDFVREIRPTKIHEKNGPSRLKQLNQVFHKPNFLIREVDNESISGTSITTRNIDVQKDRVNDGNKRHHRMNCRSLDASSVGEESMIDLTTSQKPFLSRAMEEKSIVDIFHIPHLGEPKPIRPLDEQSIVYASDHNIEETRSINMYRYREKFLRRPLDESSVGDLSSEIDMEQPAGTVNRRISIDQTSVVGTDVCLDNTPTHPIITYPHNGPVYQEHLGVDEELLSSNEDLHEVSTEDIRRVTHRPLDEYSVSEDSVSEDTVINVAVTRTPRPLIDQDSICSSVDTDGDVNPSSARHSIESTNLEHEKNIVPIIKSNLSVEKTTHSLGGKIDPNRTVNRRLSPRPLDQISICLESDIEENTPSGWQRGHNERNHQSIGPLKRRCNQDAHIISTPSRRRSIDESSIGLELYEENTLGEENQGDNSFYTSTPENIDRLSVSRTCLAEEESIVTSLSVSRTCLVEEESIVTSISGQYEKVLEDLQRNPTNSSRKIVSSKKADTFGVNSGVELELDSTVEVNSEIVSLLIEQKFDNQLDQISVSGGDTEEQARPADENSIASSFQYENVLKDLQIRPSQNLPSGNLKTVSTDSLHNSTNPASPIDQLFPQKCQVAPSLGSWSGISNAFDTVTLLSNNSQNLSSITGLMSLSNKSASIASDPLKTNVSYSQPVSSGCANASFTLFRERRSSVDEDCDDDTTSVGSPDPAPSDTLKTTPLSAPRNTLINIPYPAVSATSNTIPDPILRDKLNTIEPLLNARYRDPNPIPVTQTYRVPKPILDDASDIIDVNNISTPVLFQFADCRDQNSVLNTRTYRDPKPILDDASDITDIDTNCRKLEPILNAGYRDPKPILNKTNHRSPKPILDTNSRDLKPLLDAASDITNIDTNENNQPAHSESIVVVQNPLDDDLHGLNDAPANFFKGNSRIIGNITFSNNLNEREQFTEYRDQSNPADLDSVFDNPVSPSEETDMPAIGAICSDDEQPESVKKTDKPILGNSSNNQTEHPQKNNLIETLNEQIPKLSIPNPLDFPIDTDDFFEEDNYPCDIFSLLDDEDPEELTKKKYAGKEKRDLDDFFEPLVTCKPRREKPRETRDFFFDSEEDSDHDSGTATESPSVAQAVGGRGKKAAFEDNSNEEVGINAASETQERAALKCETPESVIDEMGSAVSDERPVDANFALYANESRLLDEISSVAPNDDATEIAVLEEDAETPSNETVVPEDAAVNTSTTMENLRKSRSSESSSRHVFNTNLSLDDLIDEPYNMEELNRRKSHDNENFLLSDDENALGKSSSNRRKIDLSKKLSNRSYNKNNNFNDEEESIPKKLDPVETSDVACEEQTRFFKSIMFQNRTTSEDVKTPGTQQWRTRKTALDKCSIGSSSSEEEELDKPRRPVAKVVTLTNMNDILSSNSGSRQWSPAPSTSSHPPQQIKRYDYNTFDRGSKTAPSSVNGLRPLEPSAKVRKTSDHYITNLNHIKPTAQLPKPKRKSIRDDISIPSDDEDDESISRTVIHLPPSFLQNENIGKQTPSITQSLHRTIIEREAFNAGSGESFYYREPANRSRTSLPYSSYRPEVVYSDGFGRPLNPIGFQVEHSSLHPLSHMTPPLVNTRVSLLNHSLPPPTMTRQLPYNPNPSDASLQLLNNSVANLKRRRTRCLSIGSDPEDEQPLMKRLAVRADPNGHSTRRNPSVPLHGRGALPTIQPPIIEPSSYIYFPEEVEAQSQCHSCPGSCVNLGDADSDLFEDLDSVSVVGNRKLEKDRQIIVEKFEAKRAAEAEQKDKREEERLQAFRKRMKSLQEVENKT